VPHFNPSRGRLRLDNDGNLGRSDGSGCDTDSRRSGAGPRAGNVVMVRHLVSDMGDGQGCGDLLVTMGLLGELVEGQEPFGCVGLRLGVVGGGGCAIAVRVRGGEDGNGLCDPQVFGRREFGGEHRRAWLAASRQPLGTRRMRIGAGERVGNKERDDLQVQLVLVVGEAQFGWGSESHPRVAGAAASADAPESDWDESCHGVTYGSKNDCAGMACGMESAGLLLKRRSSGKREAGRGPGQLGSSGVSSSSAGGRVVWHDGSKHTPQEHVNDEHKPGSRGNKNAP
jgi:hypothetical protein